MEFSNIEYHKEQLEYIDILMDTIKDYPSSMGVVDLLGTTDKEGLVTTKTYLLRRFGIRSLNQIITYNLMVIKLNNASLRAVKQ